MEIGDIYMYMYKIDYSKKWVMRSYNSRVCGCPEAKPRENRKRGSYAERLTHALAIVFLTYTTQACAVLNA